MSVSIGTGDLVISASIVVSAIGATWRLGNRFARIESKLDGHLNYHKGFDDGNKVRYDMRKKTSNQESD